MYEVTDSAAVTRRHDRAALVLLAFLATLLFVDVVVGSHNFFMRDLTRYYYPTKQVLREIVQDGEFPYWNRHFSAGQPIAANPEHEVFYPLTWLILLPDYDLGYRLHILIHIYIGLFGMYALLRSMELRPPASFFGALAFGLGGIYLSYVNLLPILFCAAWLPLTCLYVRRFLLKPGIRDFALASLVLGLQFLVGEPTTVMQTGLIIGMYAMYRGWYAAQEYGGRFWLDKVPEMLARVAFIAIISTAAILMGAAQMLPAIDHVGDSARSRIFEYTLVSAWSLPWAKLAEVIYPNILGHIAVKNVMWYWAGGLYKNMGSPFLFSIYGGLLLIAMAMAGAFVRPRGGRFVLILVLLSLLVALGGNTPLMRFLYDAGIATSIRYPEKFILIAMFAVILFASQMLQRLLDGDRAVRDAALGFILATTVVAAVVAVVAFTPLYGTTFSKMWGLVKGAGADKMIAMSRTGWIIAAVRGVVLFALVWSVGRMRRPVWLALLTLFVAADLGPVVHQLNPRMPSHFFTEPPPALRHFPADRSRFRIFHEADWYGQEAQARNYFSTGDAVYWVVRNGLFPETPAGHGLSMVIDRDYDKTALVPSIDFVDSVWDVKRSGRSDWWQPFMPMTNTWYRGEYKDFAAEKKRVKGKLKTLEAIRFTKVGEHPRYYFADQLVTVRDRKELVKKLIADTYSKRVAFVHEPSFVPADGVVHGWRETANTATIDVESRGRGFLVMSVTPHKYWQVTIDGRPVRADVTNIGFQGVVVPEGRHRVEMRYRNGLIVLAMKISAVTTVLLLAAAFFGPAAAVRLRRRRTITARP